MVRGASVSFAAPASVGSSAISSYTATCTDGVQSASASAAASPIVVSGLTPYKVYSCSVVASSAAGAGRKSLALNVTPLESASIPPTATPPSQTVPSEPLLVVPSGVVGGIVVNFQRPYSAGSTPIINFTAACTDGSQAVSAKGTQSPIVIMGLSASKTYGCAVIASNAAGDGPGSLVFNATPVAGSVATPYAPKSARAFAADRSVTINYEPLTNADVFGSPGSYPIDVTALPSARAPTTSYTATCVGGGTSVKVSAPSGPLILGNLTNGVIYTCGVTANNAAGSSPPVNAGAVTPGVPAAPVAVVINGASGIKSASISFGEAAADLDSPGLRYVTTCNGGGSSFVKTNTPGDVPHISVFYSRMANIFFDGLTPGVAYSCSVTVSNQFGSTQSNIVSVTPSDTPPPPPPPPPVVVVRGGPNAAQNVTLTAGVGSFTVTFLPAPAGATSYSIECKSSSGATLGGMFPFAPYTGLPSGVTYRCSMSSYRMGSLMADSLSLEATVTTL